MLLLSQLELAVSFGPSHPHLGINKPAMVQRNAKEVKDTALRRVLEIRDACAPPALVFCLQEGQSSPGSEGRAASSAPQVLCPDPLALQHIYPELAEVRVGVVVGLVVQKCTQCSFTQSRPTLCDLLDTSLPHSLS